VVYDFVAELAARPLLEKAIVGAMEHITSDPDLFDDFLEEQNYRLSRWRVAEQELGYRRFFDIDDLIGLRVEIPSVFADSHHLVLEWVEAGEADGLRIDHPDGLRSPGAYLSRLREAAPEAWIVVEKILAEDESLPGDWPVDGTTGYEFLNDVTALLVDAAAEDAFTALWQEFSESNLAWGEVAEQAKRDVLRDVLAADVNRLTAVFAGNGDGPAAVRVNDANQFGLGQFVINARVVATHSAHADDAAPQPLITGHAFAALPPARFPTQRGKHTPVRRIRTR
jgi:(1->4)-alpha-D-glucan 1-alpha-D-glucosylmutase